MQQLGSKYYVLLKVVLLHIKLEGNGASTYSVLTLRWSQRSKHFFFLKVVMLHIKLERNGV